nr:sulfatase-like hydrolase/transferase [Candidatus Sigynarchaeota archaeon]
MGKKYNIVLVNPDQFRGDYTTPAGHPFINTKNISRLAARGTYYDYAFTACPMCGPSRVSFVTGTYPCEHRVRNYGGTVDPDSPLETAMTIFRNAGYRSAIYGKDHIVRGPPGVSIGVLYDEGEEFCIGNNDGHPEYKYSWSSGTLTPENSMYHDLTSYLTNEGIDFVKRQAGKDSPFFLTVNYNDPHPYFACPEPYASIFSPLQFELPENFRRAPGPGEIAKLTAWRANSRSLEATDLDFKKAMAMYCGQIRLVDDSLGRIIDAIDESGLIDDTIIVFWSDHGEFVGDFGVTHKFNAFYDCMVRVPVAIWDPSGRLPRGIVPDLVETIDIMASVLDICGLPQPRCSRARSLVAPGYRPRADVYAEGGLYIKPMNGHIPGVNLKAPFDPSQWGPGAMIRTGSWKLCVYSNDVGELFDMAHDPHELHNLYDDPEYTRTKLELMERLLKRQLCQGQAPELLPEGVLAGVDGHGMPIWKNSDKLAPRQSCTDYPFWRDVKEK